MKAALALLAAAPIVLAQAADDPVAEVEQRHAAAQSEAENDSHAASPIPSGYPCNSSIPVFNPEGCAPRKLTVLRAKESGDASQGDAGTPVTPEPDKAVCRDTIEQVREENGQPALRKETADPDAPLLIAAVDHRIDGCSVMVMRNDTSDVRPLPQPAEGPVELIPAR